MDLLSFLGRRGYLPHGYCFDWSPGLLWSMVLSDTAIALAYFSIPIGLLTFLRKRSEPRLAAIGWLFSGFIFVCGITHAMDVLTIWNPLYGVQALAKIATAALSVATAIALWKLIPAGLRIPSTGQFQRAIAALEAEVGRRKSAEESAADIEEQLALTLATIDAGLITTNLRGEVVRMNAVAERITGWTRADACGRSYWEVFKHEDRPDRPPEQNVVEWMLEQGITVDTAHRVVAVSNAGVRTAVEANAALTHSDGGAVRGVLVVLKDMTQVDRAEQDLHRLAAIVESSSDAIIGKTLEGRITNWNQAACGLFGYTADEAIGQSIRMLIPLDRLDEEMRILADIVDGRIVPAFETVRLDKQGRALDVSVTISPIRDDAGRIVGGSKIARDIGPQQEARRLTQRLESENRQIQESNRLKSQFLANMSHELRSPLNAIIGFSDLLHARGEAIEPAKQQQFVGHIRTSGRHLLQLINDVLDLSKVEAGKFEFFPEPVELNGLIAEIQSVLFTQIQRKHLKTGVEVDVAVAKVVVDPARLKQVLYNYLSNAIKFTPDGGRIDVRALPEGDDLFRIEVEDTGIGIAEADLPRLFVEFQQLDAGYTKRHQGTGLGLALTRRLVQAQGGTVGVRSSPGQGSVFHIVLPRVGRSGAPQTDAAVQVRAAP